MNGDAGFAVIAVMSILLAATAAAGAAAIISRGDVMQADALLRQGELDAAIEGAAALAVADLVDERPAADPVALNGSSSTTYTVGKANVTVTAIAETGRLDLNAAQVDDIVGLLAALAVDEGAVGRVRRQLDARRGENRPWRHVVDLSALLDADDFRRAAPFLSTRAKASLDLSKAPMTLIDILPRLSAAERASERDARKRALTEVRPALPVAAFPVIALFLEASDAGGARRMEERIVHLRTDGRLAVLERRPLDRARYEALFGP